MSKLWLGAQVKFRATLSAHLTGLRRFERTAQSKALTTSDRIDLLTQIRMVEQALASIDAILKRHGVPHE